MLPYSVNVALGTVTVRNVAVGEVAWGLGRTPAQVAPAWTLRNPGVTAPVIGARTPAQLEDNLGALDVDFDASQVARLDEAGAISLGYPHDLLAGDHIRKVTRSEMRIPTHR
ncbi:aldo/keto reductase [Streptomyces minutiscleroticus]|uniref:NADP-dependent oxidoreductase domain-containing protein n=1 Tax=Streptomyces minutiscleroticus TaxID=68238 RepID=A0A918KPG6_9ACTN|nr:hypothetical protein GCM10010358_24930 [Streptomyces minutiscleroticus]